jgi:CRISPR-associated endonuclease/helicase Cas3
MASKSVLKKSNSKLVNTIKIKFDRDVVVPCTFNKLQRSGWNEPYFWAKTIEEKDGKQVPGISVFNHCLNVGCVAERLLDLLPKSVAVLLPRGSALLAALHDIGKITLGFQSKCPAWLADQAFDELTLRKIALSVSDHAYVSQFFVQEILRASKNQIWAVAVGAHHGKPKGRTINRPTETLIDWTEKHRQNVTAQLIAIFGPFTDRAPARILDSNNSEVWLLAGLITVSDWIGSNEKFFSSVRAEATDTTRQLANSALAQIGWPGARLERKSFVDTFGFRPNSVQSALLTVAESPALIIVEAPMGCGKTEAALAAAQHLIASGHHHGVYFALPTQVTSNRIHQRVARFLANSLEDVAQLRLAHGNSWMEANYDLLLRPSFTGNDDEARDSSASAEEARSWFASAKQALIAPYGVGTIDQALQGMVAVKHFFVRRFALAGKVVILDEIHSYDVYTGTLVTALVRELLNLGCTVIVLSATLTGDRRRELLFAAGSREVDAPTAYPLITCARRDAPAIQIAPENSASKTIHFRAEPMDEDTVIAELITRAEAGQHVLWIRNTVVEAQHAFRLIRGDTPVGVTSDDQIKLGLLHSRFPLNRRQELEAFWLDHLGKERPTHGPGSILVATQVVEQSVDIDLDFIVSDLAPTDMLFQRMGRLWRHPRTHRAAPHPEFWVRLPIIPPTPSADAATLKKALGRSARVYAPWVLLRAASVFTSRATIGLPDDIRPLLEATYAEPRTDEPAALHDLHAELEDDKRQLTANAEAAMLVLGRPTLSFDEDSDKALTRRKGPPTVAVVLLASIEPLPGRLTRLTALDKTAITVSDYEWSFDAARFLHRWMVRIPLWLIQVNAPCPAWLGLHLHGHSACAVVGEQDKLLWDGDASTARYHRDFGVFADKPVSARPSTLPTIDDDEFDS